MRRGHEQAADEILVAGLHPRPALAATALGAIGRQRHPLGVAGMRDRDDHVLALDQVLVLDLAFLLDDDSPARGGELLLDRSELVLDDRLNPGARAQDIQIIGDFDRELVQLFGNFLASQRGESLQPEIENGPRLFHRQPRGAVRIEPVTRIVDQRDHRLDILGRPVARHQGIAGGVRVRRGADDANDLVDIGDRDRKTDQDMGAVARLAEQEFGSARDDLLAEGDEDRQQILQIHRLRPAAVQRHHVDAERGLQRGEPVELVQDDICHRIALELDDHAETVPVGFVAQVGNALDLLLADQIADALDHGRLVNLVRNLRDDDGFAILADGVDPHLAAHHDRAAAEMVARADSLAPEDDAAGRKVRPRNDVDEIVDGKRGIVDQRDAGVDHLAEIVRRDVGCHADGDAAGAIDQEIGKLRRQNRRFLFRVVVIGLEIDGVLVDIAEHFQRRARQARFGISIGRRRIAVDRTEIALAVDQRHAHGEVLRHPHHRVIDRLVAVRMVFTDHVADDARRFDVFLVRRVPLLVHRIQDAAMYRLQTVARVRQRPRHDHAHGVIEVGTLHLVEDGYRTNIGWP